MDERSFRGRFHVLPGISGTLRWDSDSELSFVHEPFAPRTRYQVVVDPGYRDARGVANSLRHSWTFRTESPPTLSSASPGSGDHDVDPASYITLTFSREMDPASLRSAISVAPRAPFSMRQDPTDRRRVTLAPDSILEPRTTYSVAINRDALDIDGNHVEGGSLVTFDTGDLRPLRHWVAFIAQPWPEAAAPSPTGDSVIGDGVWIVNESRFPRRLVGTPVTAFAWSADGSRLLLRGPGGNWSDQPLAGTGTALSIHGEWADYLSPRLGYAFLNAGQLKILRADGKELPVADGVKAAAVVPGGSRLAFVVADASGSASQIYGYDPDLLTRYPLISEPAPIDGLAWYPDGQSLVYRLVTPDPQRRQIRVLSLRDGTVVTVATGDVSVPAWQADRRHVLFSAVVNSPRGAVSKAFRLTVGDTPPKSLTLTQAMPAAGDLQVQALSPSADGHQLAFTSAGGPAVLWLMNADGSGLTALTEYDGERFPYSCLAPAWSPS